jgi:hypothetical protein
MIPPAAPPLPNVRCLSPEHGIVELVVLGRNEEIERMRA